MGGSPIRRFKDRGLEVYLTNADSQVKVNRADLGTDIAY